MRSYTIGPKDKGTRLSRFLEKQTPGLSLSMMYRAIRTKHIKINGKRTEASYRLQENDLLEIWMDDNMLGEPEKEKRPDFMQASREIKVVYEDDNIAVLDKPKGVFSHPVKGVYSDTMISRFLRYLYEKNEYHPDDRFTPALCNRLDRNTRGLLIAAKNHNALEAVNSLIADRKIEKIYYAVCVGESAFDGIYTAYLSKDEKKNQVTVTSGPVTNSSRIITEFHSLKNRNGLSLVRAVLHTGKTHQIRAHLAFLGHPILGDTKYGARDANSKWRKKNQCLVSYELIFHTDPDSLLSSLNGKKFSVAEEPFPDLF